MPVSVIDDDSTVSVVTSVGPVIVIVGSVAGSRLGLKRKTWPLLVANASVSVPALTRLRGVPLTPGTKPSMTPAKVDGS